LVAIAYVRETLPDVQLIVAGFPNQEIDVEALQRRAAEPDLAGAVKFYLQYVPVEEVADLFEPADVAVFPYLMIYQSGALQVAYSLGKPVVATDVGGLSEAVIEGETGLLVPPRDSVALAQAITKVLSDREMAHRMGERGRELSKTENSWYGIAASVYEIYARLAASGPRRKAEPR
jgi:glycosyltransferase involved in cell wall biosynthesis